MLQKSGDEDMVGMQVPIPILTGHGQRQGTVFSTAQANTSKHRSDKFVIEMSDHSVVVDIGHKELVAGRSNAGTFLEAKVVETNGALEQEGEILSLLLWGNGGGAIGRRASASTNVITLTDPSTVANFEIGMGIVASDNDGDVATDALRDGSTTVASIDREAGTVTLTSAAAIDSFTNNDYLFRASDFYGDTGNVIVKGLQAYITSDSTSSIQALWGVTQATRQADPQRWAGCRVPSANYANKSIEERIKLLGTFMTGRFKAKRPTHGFMHPEDWQSLEVLMNARGQRTLKEEETRFGFSKIEAVMGGGVLPIFQDRHCPVGHFFALSMKNWKLYSMGKIIRQVDEDGMTMMRKASSMDFELRWQSYLQLGCNKPLDNGRVPLTG
jgi:hypothetical protein